MKDSLTNAGEKIVDAAKETSRAVAEKAGQAKDWVAGDKPECGSAKSISDIRERMDVIASCGNKVGVVDHVESGAIKLTKNDSPDGQHHFIPTGWVERVDAHVHLRKNSEEAEQEWKSDAAGCSSCGA